MHSVDNFLDDIALLKPEQSQLIASARACFSDPKLPELAEGIKYGGIAYSLDGTLVGGIYPHQSHVSVEFSQGARFSDPEGLLEGKGKQRRHIKLRTLEDIDTMQLAGFIVQAVQQ